MRLTTVKTAPLSQKHISHAATLKCHGEPVAATACSNVVADRFSLPVYHQCTASC